MVCELMTTCSTWMSAFWTTIKRPVEEVPDELELEEGDGHQTRDGQRHDDVAQDAHVAGAVEQRRLVQVDVAKELDEGEDQRLANKGTIIAQ